MLGRKSKSICEYWECNREAVGGDFLCATHREKWLKGSIDRCPKCSRFKDVMYDLCLDCYVGRRVKRRKTTTTFPKPKQSPGIQYSGTGTGRLPRQERYFIYVIEIDDRVLYVGRTMDIHNRLSELRKKKKPSAAEHNLRLLYLEVVPNEEDAEARESELKKLVQSDPGQIRMMSSDFHRKLQDLGLGSNS
jgi:predicted GIY-YIG superfamily endonuclease